MPQKREPRAQVPMSDEIKQVIADVRNTAEWSSAGLGVQVRVLACERLIQEMYANDPDSITDEFLQLIEIRRDRANEILGLQP